MTCMTVPCMRLRNLYLRVASHINARGEILKQVLLNQELFYRRVIQILLHTDTMKNKKCIDS